MEEQLDEIISGIMCTDSSRIRECTAALEQAFENPLTLSRLCQILVSPREPQVRQLAAILINRRLKKLHHWQLLPPEHQAAVKSGMLQALIGEQHKTVRNAIGQLIGTLVRHEAAKNDLWLADLLANVNQRCSMADPKESVLGALLFSTLADAAPGLFNNQMPESFQLFSFVLMSAQSYGNMATPTVANMMEGITALIPLVGGHTAAEQTLANVVPLMLSALQTFARIGAESEFSSGFDILDAMVEHAPKLLSPHIKSVVHFCLETLASKQLDDSIRVQVVSFVGCIVCVKKQLIVKHKLLQPILVVVVEMICTESESESDEADALDNYFSGAGNTPGASATQALEQMSVHISSETLLHTLVPIIDPALLSGDPLYCRGGYMCLALISEGCSEAFKRNNLEKMLSIIIKRGVVDKDPGVRSVAFFALGQFSEYMQPQISAFAIQILPVLLDFLHSLVLEKALDQSEGPCYMTYDRMFYALEVYCENLEDKIVPYLPVLVERLLGCMDPRNIVKIRQLALSSISAVATASKENFLPYFPTIMDALKQYLVYECSESLNPLRIQAIDTLSSISRTVGKENFMHLAQDTTQFTLTMLEQGPDDPDMRRAIYSLIGGLAIVVTENMATVLPKIMERILQTVATTEQDCRTENEQDGDVEDDDKDDSDDYELQVQNDYLFEKAEAILTLKEFAVNSYKSFSPYLTRALEAVYKNIDHGQEVIRKASVDALCAFVIALDNVLDTEGVLRACAILMPKFSKLIQTDKEPCVVRNLLCELDDLIRAVKSAAFATPEQAEIVVGAIAGVLQNNTACQDSEHSDGGAGEVDNEESECNEVLVESACDLVATIGQALDRDTFSMCFGRLYHLLLAKLGIAKRNDNPDRRSLVYGVLSECIQPLGIRVITYFDALCPVFLDGTNDSKPEARLCCFFGLGELVYNAEDKSFGSFSVILQALSNAIASEKDASVLDNICGALARLTITNFNLVPLANVLPVFISVLPIRTDLVENAMVLKAFRVLYVNARPSVVDFISQMVSITLHVLFNGQFDDCESHVSAITFMLEIQSEYPDHFNNVVNSCTSANFLEFVQSVFS